MARVNGPKNKAKEVARLTAKRAEFEKSRAAYPLMQVNRKEANERRIAAVQRQIDAV